MEYKDCNVKFISVELLGLRSMYLLTFSDINECNLEMDNCDLNADCTNTIGGFSCQCNTGYSGSGVTCSEFECV